MKKRHVKSASLNTCFIYNVIIINLHSGLESLIRVEKIVYLVLWEVIKGLKMPGKTIAYKILIIYSIYAFILLQYI